MKATNGVVAEQTIEEPLPDALAEDLKQRLEALEAQAHNQHSIAPEVIESIIREAAKHAVQQVVTQLRKTADILEALEK